MREFKLIIEIATEENIEGIDELLKGSWLYNDEFRGAITKSYLYELLTKNGNKKRFKQG